MNTTWLVYKFIRINFNECWNLNTPYNDQVFRYLGRPKSKGNEVKQPILEVFYEDGKGLHKATLQSHFINTDTPSALINRDILHVYAVCTTIEDIK